MLEEWRRTGQNKAALLRGPALKDALKWMRERAAGLTELEVEFIRRSRRRHMRQRAWLAVMLALAAVLLAAWPVLQLLSGTNPAIVWGTGLMAHIHLVSARPSAVADWIKALDAAGRLDTIGSAIPFFPTPDSRARALERGASNPRRARTALGRAKSRASRIPLSDAIAAALTQLGSIDEAMKMISNRSGWPIPVERDSGVC
jgi:hypothetical protein